MVANPGTLLCRFLELRFRGFSLLSISPHLCRDELFKVVLVLVLVLVAGPGSFGSALAGPRTGPAC